MRYVLVSVAFGLCPSLIHYGLTVENHWEKVKNSLIHPLYLIIILYFIYHL